MTAISRSNVSTAVIAVSPRPVAADSTSTHARIALHFGLGAQAGEASLRAVFEEAGFSRFRRATETPLNLILEARP